jgi:hypothetical protein
VLLGQQARFYAAANSALRHTDTAKCRTIADKHNVAKEGWSIGATDNLTVQAVPGMEEGRLVPYSEAEKDLRKLQ